VGVGVQLPGRRLERQARLAAAARPDQRQQPAARIGQARPDLSQQRLAADKGSELGGQVREYRPDTRFLRKNRGVANRIW
jgi:hypothetical protein